MNKTSYKTFGVLNVTEVRAKPIEVPKDQIKT